jgi:hypothetical protein
MVRHCFFLLIYLLTGYVIKAQQTPEMHVLKFECSFNGKPILRDDSLRNWVNKPNFYFTKVRQYISGIRLLRSGNEVWKDSGGFYLIDFLDSEKSKVLLKTHSKDFDEIQFTAGIDSSVQVEGVKGGALDPVNGMYWTWQSGYIHTKIEGCYLENNEKTTVELHLGGYKTPNSTAISVALKNVVPSAICHIQFDISPLLVTMRQLKINKVMSPGSHAAALSRIWADHITAQP